MGKNALGRDPFEILQQSNMKEVKTIRKERKEVKAAKNDKYSEKTEKQIVDKKLQEFQRKIDELIRENFEKDPAFVKLRKSIDQLEKLLEETAKIAEAEKGIYNLEKKKPYRKLSRLLQLLSGYLPLKLLLREFLNIFVFTSYEDIDEFGFSESFRKRVEPFFSFFYERWFRVEVSGLENIPERGGVILVANHAGMIPWDAAMLTYAIRHNPPFRQVRPLIENLFFYLPFLGVAISRLGGVRANYMNALRLIKKGEIVAVFPEGVKGLGKPYRERYRLQRFARGGVARLHLETEAPVIPVGIVGSEEAHPILFSSEYLASRLNLPFFPITLTFPWLGIIGLLPLPSKWYITIGEPLNFSKEVRDQKDVDEDILISKITNRIREVVHELLYETIKKRKSAFLG